MITLRPATAEDEQTIRTILRESFLDSYVHFMPREHIERSIRNDRAGEIARKQGLQFTIAETDGAPGGVMLLSGDFIEFLFTHPEHMGKGLGTALLESAEQRVREQGHKRLTLNCYKENHKAQDFYRSRGFVIEKTFEDKDSMPGIYNCFLAKQL
ncbi:GNAT family N-acetyltransferase [Salidesulfovibrio onnuriiensis]|uniref:GNAT family N-acetyltransferase n=1 Tax=Salidesulfovibrio onnuriiensis TaxID=2583823 RepID=UPI00164F8CC2|nr:GNAT family N-acetyltransferase [Salidesulfovibrio onnuriiensis]